MDATLGEILLFSVVFFLVGLLLKDYLPSYSRKKGENLATKEDISGITQQVESVKASIGFEKDRERQFLNTSQEYLMNFFDEITEFYYELAAVNFGDFPNDDGKSLFEYQRSFYKSVAMILKTYQRLVIFLPPDSKLLEHAKEITVCAKEGRAVVKKHFGSVKITLIRESQVYSKGNRDEIELAVQRSNEANLRFWSEMEPHVVEFQTHLDGFLNEMNSYVSPSIAKA